MMNALQQSTVGQAADFKQIQKRCMPFLRFKKDEAIKIGAQALDLMLPFGEIEVLKENLDLIKRQLGLEEVEVLSATDPDAYVQAGPHSSLLKQNPPSPGNPTAIFLSRKCSLEKMEFIAVCSQYMVYELQMKHVSWSFLQAALRVVAQTHGGTPEHIAALQTEAEEEVFLKRCWVARYWSLCVEHVERGLMELRKLGLESQLRKTSRQGLELSSTTILHIETGF
ncbi:hypothetical protein REPUB_Repub16aG0094000 [Reevesia pubescens]